MPTLVRLLTFLALAAGLVVAVMAALVYFVQPVPHPVSVQIPVTIPPADPPPAPPSPPAPAAVAPSPEPIGTAAAEALRP